MNHEKKNLNNSELIFKICYVFFIINQNHNYHTLDFNNYLELMLKKLQTKIANTKHNDNYKNNIIYHLRNQDEINNIKKIIKFENKTKQFNFKIYLKIPLVLIKFLWNKYR